MIIEHASELGGLARDKFVQFVDRTPQFGAFINRETIDGKFAELQWAADRVLLAGIHGIEGMMPSGPLEAWSKAFWVY